jgi:hypothetical protein
MMILMQGLLQASYISYYTSQATSYISSYAMQTISSSEQTFMGLDGSHCRQTARGPGESGEAEANLPL